MTIYTWSTTAATNATADATADLADNQPGIDTRNSVRAVMARLAAWLDQIGGTATYGGTGNAYTMTSPSGHALTAYAAGNMVCLVPNATSTGAATINVDGLGAKNIVTADGGAVIAGDLVSGGRYLLAYDGTAFQVFNTLGGGAYQPLDATLTAFAGLTFSGDTFLKATGADTFVVESASTHRTSMGLGTAATVNTGTSGATIPLLDGANTWSAAQTYSNDVSFSRNAIFTQWHELDGPADAKRWFRNVDNGLLVEYIANDANSVSAQWLVVSRSGVTVTSINFPSGTLQAGGNTVYHAGNLPGTAITWTAAQTFSANAGAGIILSGTAPYITLAETDSGATSGFLVYDGGQLSLRVGSLSDAGLVVTTNALTFDGNTVYHAGNLPGTAITWTASQAFDNLGTTSFVNHDAAGRAFAVRPASAGSVGIIQFTNHALSSQWSSIEARSTGLTITSDIDITTGSLLSPVRAATGVSGTLTRASHANRTIVCSGGVTINNSVFSAGDIVSGYNDSGSTITLTEGSGVTMRLGGTATTGNRTVAARGRFEIYFLSASECIVSGAVT